MAKQEKVEVGARLYDSFRDTLRISFGREAMRVPTPSTGTLELFAVLKERKMYHELAAEMCREFVSGSYAPDELFVREGVLHIRETVERVLNEKNV